MKYKVLVVATTANSNSGGGASIHTNVIEFDERAAATIACDAINDNTKHQSSEMRVCATKLF
jgi:hypothetical protein